MHKLYKWHEIYIRREDGIKMNTDENEYRDIEKIYVSKEGEKRRYLKR